MDRRSSMNYHKDGRRFLGENAQRASIDKGSPKGFQR